MSPSFQNLCSRKSSKSHLSTLKIIMRFGLVEWNPNMFCIPRSQNIVVCTIAALLGSDTYLMLEFEQLPHPSL